MGAALSSPIAEGLVKYKEMLIYMIIILEFINAILISSISTQISEDCDTDPVRSLITSLLWFNWAVIAFIMGYYGCADYTETTACLIGGFTIDNIRIFTLIVIITLSIIVNFVLAITILAEYQKKDGNGTCIASTDVITLLQASMGLNGFITISFILALVAYYKSNK